MNEQINLFTNYIKKLNELGHSPATSGNYSYRVNDKIYVSESGIDKEYFSKDNWLLYGQTEKKTSAETDLHLEIYNQTEANFIIHSHKQCFNIEASEIKFSNQEILKAINGIKTHDFDLFIPVFHNTQDIKTLSQNIFNGPDIKKAHCFIIQNHGLTVWGKDFFETKRHLEAYVYLFQLNL